MHRAARSATADHVRALLQQLLFVHRVKLLAMEIAVPVGGNHG